MKQCNPWVRRIANVLVIATIAIVAAFSLMCDTVPASSASFANEPAPANWGKPVVGMTATYTIYQKDFVYGMAPFTVTDMRADDGSKVYSDKEGYEIRSLSVYRPYDGQKLLDHRPVVFFVHGGGWTDGYKDWYQFVARPFTGEQGWVTVVIDYRLTSDQVFIADQYCPDRATCGLPENESLRTKSAWYPDDINDVASAFQWVLHHIGGNGGNPNEVVLFGHSAGGHLVSLLAASDDYETSLRPKVEGVVSMSGAYDLNSFNHVFWGDVVSQTFQGGFSNYDLLAEASPATYPVSGTVLSPFYLLYSENDLLNLTAQALQFDNLLESVGDNVTISYLPGYGHYSEMEAIAHPDEQPTQLIVQWIKGIFREKALYLPLIYFSS